MSQANRVFKNKHQAVSQGDAAFVEEAKCKALLNRME